MKFVKNVSGLLIKNNAKMSPKEKRKPQVNRETMYIYILTILFQSMSSNIHISERLA